MARLLFGGSSDDQATDSLGRPVPNRRVRFYTSAARTTEITDLASDAAGTGAPLTVTTDSHGYWGPVYGPDAVTVMYAATVDADGNPPTYVVAVYTHSSSAAGVASFNTRTGAVTLTKADVTATALAASDVGAENVVVHGATAGTARPAGATVVHWIGSVAPTNVSTNDEWTDTTNKILKRWNGSSFDSLGSAASTASGFFYPTASTYGAKADGKSLADGAMTTGTAVLTSATAGFTSADVGKLVVVCNAKGAGTHLYGTISGYTNATTVTLSTSATATVSAADFSYGTDDTTALLAAAADAKAVNGVLALPSTPICTSAPLVVDGSYTIQGNGCVESVEHMAPVGGVYNGTNGSIAACNIPTASPYLRGSQLLVMTANTDAVQITCPAGSLTVPMQDFGVRFAGMFGATGHGINQTAAALAAPGTGFDQGLTSSAWSKIKVFGHDGTHYAYKILNPLLNTFSHCRSYGGGGWQVEANSSAVNEGNSVWVHPYTAVVSGGVGMDLKATTGVLNLLSMIRPQVINGVPNLGPTIWSAFGSKIAGPTYLYQDNGADRVSLISADMETGAMHVTSTGKYFISSDSMFQNGFYEDSGASPVIKTGPKRDLASDLSHRLWQAETSGSSWHVLEDKVSSVTWGITTDGTVQMLRPGVTRHTGSTPSCSSGAAVGTGAPPCIPSGADSAGRAIFGSGTSPTTGTIASFTFARAMQVGAVVKINPNNAATAALGLYATNLTTTGFDVACTTSPTASQAVTVYDFGWSAEDVTAAPVAPVVYDNFNRVDNASVVGSPQIGSAPTVLSGTWGISSNRLYTTTGGKIVWDAGKTNATWIWTYAAAGVAAQEGPIFRAVDANNYWQLAMDGTLYKVVAGSFTSAGSAGAFSAGDVIKIVTLGNSITVFKNGGTTALLSVTDAQFNTATKGGAAVNSATNFRIDNIDFI